MFGKKKIHTYNSRSYEFSNTNDFEEFYDLVDKLNDFDFACEHISIIYTGDYSKATLHVETAEKVMEIWLIKHQFVEA